MVEDNAAHSAFEMLLDWREGSFQMKFREPLLDGVSPCIGFNLADRSSVPLSLYLP